MLLADQRQRRSGWAVRLGTLALLGCLGFAMEAQPAHGGGQNTADERKHYRNEVAPGDRWSAVAPLGTLPAPSPGVTRPFIDWANLKNPVLAEPDRMLKDQAVVWQDGWFYLFPSQRIQGDGPWSYYRTRDFKSYERFDDPDLHGGSPDIKRLNDGRWVLVRQNPTPNADRRLFYTISHDLLQWTTGRALAVEIQPGLRQIDGTLAREGKYYYLLYKGDQTPFVTRARSLDGPWHEPLKVKADGWCENFQFIKIDGRWRVVATAQAPPGYRLKKDGYTGNHEPFIFTVNSEGDRLKDFARLQNKTHLVVPWEDWNRAMHANSAFICDWRNHDGYFYLFYAGANDDKSFDGRGHDKIGVVRSKDLVNWRLPGDMR